MPHNSPESYYRNTEQAQRTARHLIDFVLANEGTLRTVANGLKWKEIVSDFKWQMENEDPLTPNQLSYLEGIYEKVVGALTGLPSVPVKHDPGPRRERP